MKRLKELNDPRANVERLWADTGADRTERPAIQAPPDQEVRRLQSTLDELTMSLEKANRRINRLVGEKNQLSALLDKRDEQIQSLSRELGGFQAATADTSAGNGGARRTLARLAGAIGILAERASQPFVSSPGARENEDVGRRQDDVEPAAQLRTPLAARLGSSAGNRMVAALLFGLDREGIERLLPIIERDCSERKTKPLCLVDMDAFEMFRTRGIIFEYLPPDGDRQRFNRSLHWDLYMQRRLALIRQKWNPVRVVAFGPVAANFLTLWSSSPFETSPLPTAAGAKAAML